MSTNIIFSISNFIHMDLFSNSLGELITKNEHTPQLAVMQTQQHSFFDHFQQNHIRKGFYDKENQLGCTN